MLGYYKSSFPKKDGKGKAYYALTQFEPCKFRTLSSSPYCVLTSLELCRPGPSRFRALLPPELFGLRPPERKLTTYSQPAFDEPAQKATYSISLISRTGTVSLANTDVESTKHLGAGGAFPRTDLLGDQFFQSETEKEVVGKTVKTEGKTETVVDKVEQDDADFKGMRQFLY